MGDFQSALPAVGWGLTGYAGVRLIPGFIGRMAPQMFATAGPGMAFVVDLAAAAGTGAIVGAMAGRKRGTYALIGGLVTIGAKVVDQFVLAPMGLSEYIPEGEVGTYLEQGDEETVGYLSPGQSVMEDYAGDSVQPPARLNPNNRF